MRWCGTIPTGGRVGTQLPEKKYFKIGEAASIVGVEPHTIRYWEKEFRAIRPAKTRSQQRLFRPRDVRLLLLIRHLLHGERFTIDGARRKLKELADAGITVEDALEAAESGLPIDPASVPAVAPAALEEELATLRGALADRDATIESLRQTDVESVRRELAKANATNDALRDTVTALRHEVERLRTRLQDAGGRPEAVSALRVEMQRRWRAVLDRAHSEAGTGS